MSDSGDALARAVAQLREAQAALAAARQQNDELAKQIADLNDAAARAAERATAEAAEMAAKLAARDAAVAALNDIITELRNEVEQGKSSAAALGAAIAERDEARAAAAELQIEMDQAAAQAGVDLAAALAERDEARAAISAAQANADAWAAKFAADRGDAEEGEGITRCTGYVAESGGHYATLAEARRQVAATDAEAVALALRQNHEPPPAAVARLIAQAAREQARRERP